MIDVHCHINLLENAQEIINDGKNKMKAIIISVADPKELGNALALHNSNKDFVYVCAGIHPHQIKDYDDSEIEEYMNQIRSSRFDIVGIGETGLDYYGVVDEDAKIKQRKSFAKFIELGIELSLPIVVHIREAYDDAFEILSRYKPTVVLHCFSGSETHLKAALEKNYFISYATNVWYTKKHPRLAALTPTKNMLLETDAPWNDPDLKSFEERRDKLTNMPWKIAKSADVIGQMKKMLPSDILNITTNNARHVFNIQ